jgi:hypothetical protein
MFAMHISQHAKFMHNQAAWEGSHSQAEPSRAETDNCLKGKKGANDQPAQADRENMNS